MMTAPAPMMTARVITTILRLLKLIHTYIVVMTLAVIMGGRLSCLSHHALRKNMNRTHIDLRAQHGKRPSRREQRIRSYSSPFPCLCPCPCPWFGCCLTGTPLLLEVFPVGVLGAGAVASSCAVGFVGRDCGPPPVIVRDGVGGL